MACIQNGHLQTSNTYTFHSSNWKVQIRISADTLLKGTERHALVMWMSPDQSLCLDLSSPLCPKPYFSGSPSEITGNAPQQWQSPCWGLGWKLDATASASLSHLYSFLKSYWFFTFQMDLKQLWLFLKFIFKFCFPFSTKFVIERDRSSPGTPDSGCTGLLPLLIAVPSWYRPWVLLG